jgi:hypothetical protein
MITVASPVAGEELSLRASPTPGTRALFSPFRGKPKRNLVPRCSPDASFDETAGVTAPGCNPDGSFAGAAAAA